MGNRKNKKKWGHKSIMDRREKNLPIEQMTHIFLQYLEKQQITSQHKLSNKQQSKQEEKKQKLSQIKIIRKQHLLTQSQFNNANQQKFHKVYNFYFKKFIIEVFTAYCITIFLIFISNYTNFPFFQIIASFFIAYSQKPFKITNLIILFTIPMIIANNYLQIQILTYPQFIIFYCSTTIFSNATWKGFIWLVNAFLFVIFGWFVLIQIGLKLKSNKSIEVLYFFYPLLLAIFKTISGILNSLTNQPNQFYLQFSFFLNGITYGMVLSLSPKRIQFWYLMVLLTLQIINSRFQFIINVYNIFCQRRKRITIVQPLFSGYTCVNSFHLFIFVYIICQSKLKSSYFNSDLNLYIKEWYMPIVIWILFSIYQIISLLKLKNCQTILIIGFKNNQFYHCIFRCIGLILGLWMFYLGFCIPYQLFLK